MATINWYLLPKSQVDNETIEEAIARLIAEHEADEESHLGTGESLQSHKAAEIIDHLASSIVEDKLRDEAVTGRKITSEQIIAKDFRTAIDVGAGVDGVKFDGDGIEMWEGGVKKVNIPKSGNPSFEGKLTVQDIVKKKFVLDTVFESIDAYSTDTDGTGATATLLTAGAVELYPGTDDNGWASIGLISGAMVTRPITDEYVLEVGIWVDDEDETDLLISNGMGYSFTGLNGIGIYWDAAASQLSLKLKTPATLYTRDINGVGIEGAHRWRIECNATAIKIYKDDTLIYTESIVLPDEWAEQAWLVFCRANGTSSSGILLTDLRLVQTRDFDISS